MSPQLRNLLIIAGVIVLVGGTIFGASQLRDSQRPAQARDDAERILRSDAYVTGNTEGAVTLVEFGDFQCPACASIEPTIQKLIADKGDTLKFAFRNFPLTTIHPNAFNASIAAEAAGLQGKYWDMHNLLYERQNDWNTSNNVQERFVAYAEELQLDRDAFRTALDDRALRDKIERDQADGYDLGVNSTPTFYLNGEKYLGQLDEASLSQAIDAATAE